MQRTPDRIHALWREASCRILSGDSFATASGLSPVVLGSGKDGSLRSSINVTE